MAVEVGAVWWAYTVILEETLPHLHLTYQNSLLSPQEILIALNQIQWRADSLMVRLFLVSWNFYVAVLVYRFIYLVVRMFRQQTIRREKYVFWVDIEKFQLKKGKWQFVITLLYIGLLCTLFGLIWARNYCTIIQIVVDFLWLHHCARWAWFF